MNSFFSRGVVAIASASLLTLACTSTPKFDETGRDPAAATRSLKAAVQRATPRNPGVTFENQPDLSKAPRRAKACGYLMHTESNRVARDLNDSMYVLRVDCRTYGPALPNRFIEFDRNTLIPNHKRVLTMWQRDAALQSTKGDKAGKRLRREEVVPYICMIGEMRGQVCTDSVVTVERVEHLSKNPQMMKSKAWRL